MRYLDASKLVTSHDMGYCITIYCDDSRDITPDHRKTPGKHNFNEKRPPCCGLRFSLAPCRCPLIALFPAWPFLSSFRCPSDGYIIGLTVRSTNTNLVPSRLRQLPEYMIAFVPLLFSFSNCLFFLLHISHGMCI